MKCSKPEAPAFITGALRAPTSIGISSATVPRDTTWRSSRVPSGGRVAYMDTTAQLPGFVELIELGGAFEPVFNGFYRASIGWDGQDPVRPFA